jgi:2-polyprenyl-3-methyl-5-hydroxy-6-metoxy-1,4-benzoquinol methylase
VTQIEELFTRIASRNPLQRSFLARLREDEALTAGDRNGLESYLAYAVSAGETLDDLAASYDQIVRDTLREQIFFNKHDRYRHARFSDVAASVYFDAAYMSRYMHGLALTSFLWPSHASIRRHFMTTLDAIPSDKKSRYLEVGPGHGFYLTAASRSGFAHVEGIDLSPTSVALTQQIVASGHFGSADGCVIRQGDFLEASFDAPFDMLVMGEVLEHVEEPKRFLRRLRELARPGATVYVTTCANSPAVDHIYLFRTTAEVRRMAESEGFRVRSELALPHHGTTIDESIARRLPINIALVLSP